MNRGFRIGFGTGIVVGSVVAALATTLVSGPRALQLRRILMRWVLRREPHVEFEVLQQ